MVTVEESDSMARASSTGLLFLALEEKARAMPNRKKFLKSNLVRVL